MLYLGLLRCPENEDLVQSSHCTRTKMKDCNNYRGIKLLSHTLKLWEMAIYLLRRIIGLYRDRKVDFHMVFIYLVRAYDYLLGIFELLRIYTWEVGRVLGR